MYRISSRRLQEACWRLCRSISDRPTTQLLLTVASHPLCSISQRVWYRQYRTLRSLSGSASHHAKYTTFKHVWPWQPASHM